MGTARVAEETTFRDRPLAAAVAAVGALWLVSSLFRPATESRPGGTAMVIVGLLVATHAALYVGGEALRHWWGVRIHLVVQGAVLFALGLVPEAILLTVTLTAAFTAYAIRALAGQLGATAVGLASIAALATSTAISGGVYRGATLALLLAAIGVVVQASRRLPASTGPAAAPHAAMPENARDGGDTGELTEREIEVLRLVAAGKRSKEIAAQLGITERTVKAHLAGAYRKLGVDSRAAAVARAAHIGIL